jgi:hypothetical protein
MPLPASASIAVVASRPARTAAAVLVGFMERAMRDSFALVFLLLTVMEIPFDRG